MHSNLKLIHKWLSLNLISPKTKAHESMKLLSPPLKISLFTSKEKKERSLPFARNIRLQPIIRKVNISTRIHTMVIYPAVLPSMHIQRTSCSHLLNQLSKRFTNSSSRARGVHYTSRSFSQFNLHAKLLFEFAASLATSFSSVAIFFSSSFCFVLSFFFWTSALLAFFRAA